MNQVISINDKIYAFKNDINELPIVGSTDWYGKPYEPLQGSLMHYNGGKVFKTHKHKLNPRTIGHTQEAFIVIKGKIKVDIFTTIEEAQGSNSFVVCSDSSNPLYNSTENYRYALIGSLMAQQGEAIFVWDGFHKISILEDDTLVYEIKCGQFTNVQDDKIFKEFKEVEYDN
jgi:hypothetical protein